MKKYLVLGLAALLLTAVVSPESALAGAGGNGNGARGGDAGSTIVLDQTDPHFGDQVTFTISTSVAKPWVRARCYQGGSLVYEQWHGMYPDYLWDPVFTLGPTPSWTSGGASCMADMLDRSRRKDVVLASTTFDVLP